MLATVALTESSLSFTIITSTDMTHSAGQYCSGAVFAAVLRSDVLTEAVPPARPRNHYLVLVAMCLLYISLKY